MTTGGNWSCCICSQEAEREKWGQSIKARIPPPVTNASIKALPPKCSAAFQNSAITSVQRQEELMGDSIQTTCFMQGEVFRRSTGPGTG